MCTNNGRRYNWFQLKTGRKGVIQLSREVDKSPLLIPVLGDRYEAVSALRRMNFNWQIYLAEEMPWHQAWKSDIYPKEFPHSSDQFLRPCVWLQVRSSSSWECTPAAAAASNIFSSAAEAGGGKNYNILATATLLAGIMLMVSTVRIGQYAIILQSLCKEFFLGGKNGVGKCYATQLKCTPRRGRF